MTIEIASFVEACQILGISPEAREGFTGEGWVELRDEFGNLKELSVFHNLITDVGDEYYAERAAGISSPPNQISGMRLGTNNATATKNGAGAAIGTYAGTGITASKAIDATWPQGSQSAGNGYQVQWRTSWAAGECTVNGLQEIVITNEGTLTDVAGTAANTVGRAVLTPAVNKAALDTLVATWNHLLKGV